MMKSQKLTRRTFLSLTASAGLFMLGGLSGACSRFLSKSVTVYRRSGKGRHVSNAAKKHNANHLYSTMQAAAQDPAHPGDRSKVVKITISNVLYKKLFSRGNLVADLRHDL
jgi:hypothetical protein